MVMKFQVLIHFFVAGYRSEFVNKQICLVGFDRFQSIGDEAVFYVCLLEK